MFAPPESPRWLVAHDRRDEARRALARVRTEGADLGAEIAAVAEAVSRSADARTRGWRGLTRQHCPLQLTWAALGRVAPSAPISI
ncbi:MFS transporter [Methylobacterium nonmethylotrophicum]